jgi:ribonuclease HI
MRVRIYTDGACSGNPGPGGWAAVLLFENDKQEISGCEDDTTNNRMELTSIVEALLLAYKLGYKKVDVFSDSAYVVNAIRDKWIQRWVLNGWQTTVGKDVKNKDLWKKLLQLQSRGMEINMVKVKGHSGDKYNDRVDLLAKKEIERLKA